MQTSLISDYQQVALPIFLADTWWYSLTRRFNDQDFQSLAELRQSQGFNAIQLVVGVPPEVGPENPNAWAEVGPPWTLQGDINTAYLTFARQRVDWLNQLGFTVIVYGAWGHQIDWMGVEFMQRWWKHLIETLDDKNVVYCITGEINLGLENPSSLLPDKSTDDLVQRGTSGFWGRHPLPAKIFALARRVRRKSARIAGNMGLNPSLKQRMLRWNQILEYVSELTQRGLLIHCQPGEISNQVVYRPDLLAAFTVQTGHTPTSRQSLWQIPRKILSKHPDATYINLEPWYEGILDQFGTEDQLFAYWVSMLAGAHAHCYGAHGIWNVGDGNFLAHWGTQTFEQAVALSTPHLLGASHRLFLETGARKLQKSMVHYEGDRLISIGRTNGTTSSLTYYPNIAMAYGIGYGQYFRPTEGKFITELPADGPLVVVTPA